ncbi:MAG: hypothetical protein OEZ59_02035 [Deltaproteobacteria bacterium]|nr:hypothetical protein [Deltaproteobacteria bacterium]
MNCASAIVSRATPRSARCLPPLAGLLALLVLLTGCSGMGSDSSEKTVLATKQGESHIVVTESEEDGGQIVRIKMNFRGQENTITLNIDQPVYDVEIPLSLENVMPMATKPEVRGPEGQFQDLLIAQYLQKAQDLMMSGDYNGALRQVNLVLLTQPDHLQAHVMKGSVYYALGNYQLANEEWEYVLSLDPSNVEVNKFMDFMKNRQGRTQPPLPGSSGTPGAQPPPKPAGTPKTAQPPRGEGK